MAELPPPRKARGGVLIVGGGFGGVTVARELGWRGATIVNVQNSMLFTPMLPEVAGGIIDMRNAMTPLAMVCPHAEIIPGRVTDLALKHRHAEVQTDGGLRLRIEYDNVVVAVGAVPRTFPIPGLTEYAVGCNTVLDALYLRNQLLRLLAAAEAEPDPERRRRHLTFVFVGAGFAGVEALAELHCLAQDALRYHPTLRDVPQRWILVEGAPKILGQIPSRLGQYVQDRLGQLGVELRLGTRLVTVVDGRAALSDGTECDAGMIVWTAGVRANPVVSHFGLPQDERGRVPVGPTLQVEGYDDVWALGDCAAVPNEANHGDIDPPTSQHALRQGRRLGKNLLALQEGRAPQSYNFRSLGQVATLGRKEGIADLRGIRLTGLSGWLAARAVHLMQVPRRPQRIGVIGNWAASLFFPGNLVTVAGLVDAPSLGTGSAPPVASPVRLPEPPNAAPLIEDGGHFCR
ncbi:MAG: FAD-dependent oxidoreductase [Micrococcales bacterium]|nr:FAD-dependent oxidoreductase [Micrococcales bacterium]